MFVVVDGKEKQQYNLLMGKSLTFSPDSKSIACVAVEGDQFTMVLDDKKGNKYDDISNPIFSPDSKHVAYVATAGKMFVVVDGKEGQQYKYIHDIIFSPDSNFVAYIAQASGKSFVVVNGKEGKKYDVIFSPKGVNEPQITVDSPDSLHYYAFEDNSTYLVEVKIVS
jgi:WD40 repeat protein